MARRRRPVRPLSLCLLALLALFGAPGCAPPRPPNIVLIISDDHAWNDFGFMGSEVVETPHLDSLAREGMVFPSTFNTASVCQPALLTLLTGLHPLEFSLRLEVLRKRGVQDRAFQEIRYFHTLPSLLAEQGFASFQGGKYWQGSFAMGGFTHGMTHRFGEQAPEYRDAHRYAGADGLALGRETMEPLWEFIGAHRDQPFFLWFAPSLPHRPFDAPQGYLERYGGKGLRPAQVEYYANITRLDDVVGELVRHLEEQGLRDDTLIVFLADNGWQPDTGQEAIEKFFGGPRGKASVYELGFRTPLVFSWPGVLPQGVRDERLVSTTDLFPTLLDVAGAPHPAGRDGMSLLPLLRGEGDFDRPAVLIETGHLRNEKGVNARSPDKYLVATQAFVLRNPDWYYIWLPQSGRQELYDVHEDPFQEKNVVSRNRATAQRLRSEVRSWRSAILDGVGLLDVPAGRTPEPLR